MRRAMLISGAFHVVVLTTILMGMPSRPADLPSESAISVDIVTEPTPLAKAPAPEAAESAPLPKREAASPTPRPAPPVKPEPSKPAQPKTQSAEAEPPKPAPTPAPPPAIPQQLSAPPAPPQVPPPASAPAKVAEPPPPPPPAPAATPKVAEALPTPLEAPAAKPEEPKPVEQAAAEPPKPAPAAKAKPPEPAKSAPPKVEQAREAVPQIAAPPPSPKPPEPRRTETAQKVEPKKAPPKVEAKVEEAKKPAQPEDSFAALLKSVEQLNKRVQSPTTRSGKGSAEAPGTASGSSRSTGLSPAAVNAIVVQASRQMADCWKIQAGLPGLDKIQPFDVNVEFNPDGTAARVDIVDKARLSSDPLFRVVAESAQRAAWSCRLTLPGDSYGIWRSITFSFDPKTAVTG